MVIAVEKSAAKSSTVDWDAFRRQFPALERFCYLDTARKALTPAWSRQAANGWFDDVDLRVGKQAFSMDMIEDTRMALAGLMGAPKEQIALIKNTSEGVNILANGLGIAAGENVVLSTAEHENNTFPWRYLERRGIEVRILEADPDGSVPLARYRAAVDAKTRIVSVAWVNYGTGHRAPLQAIAEIAHRANAYIMVDGIQAVGILSQNLPELGVDAVICGGHKTMLSVAGAGFMYLAPHMVTRIQPVYGDKFSFTSLDRTTPLMELAQDCRRFDYGNPNFLGVWIQGESARRIKAIGLKNIENRVAELSDAMIQGLSERQAEILTPLERSRRAGIVSIRTKRSVVDVVADLARRDIVVSEKDGILRMSLYAYNSMEDIDRFFEAGDEIGL